MPEYLSPGVYVEEFESGSMPMEGVSTSTAGFVGVAERGPVVGVPELVTNFSDFLRKFGGYLQESKYGENRYLPHAVEHFFINGGSRCFVMRVAPEDAKASSAHQNGEVMEITASNPGSWGDRVRVYIEPSSKAKTQVLEVLSEKSYKVKNSAGFNPGDVVEYLDGETRLLNRVVASMDNILEFEEAFSSDVTDTKLLPTKLIRTSEINIVVKFDEVKEVYENVSFNHSAANFIETKLAKSEIVKINVLREIEGKGKGKAKGGETLTPFAQLGGGEEFLTIALEGGSDGNVLEMAAGDYIGVDAGPGKRTGLQSFIENNEASIMAIPGVTSPDVQLSLVAHCENLKSRFAVLDIPREKKKVQDVLEHRDMFDTNYAAMYHPWLEVYDPLNKKSMYIPPSGSIVGVYSRTDSEKGVFKAPANEGVRACTGLDCLYNEGEQDILNPKGVNLIRNFTGKGIKVWGARTCSSNGQWKYVNVRRLFIFLEESIKANTNWVVFEPNTEVLWLRVKRSIELFLASVWRSGALAGTTPGEAYYVDIGRTTMTQDDIDNGRLICVIAVAPVKPAEFVIFRITQKTSEAQA